MMCKLMHICLDVSQCTCNDLFVAEVYGAMKDCDLAKVPPLAADCQSIIVMQPKP
jgi:hypothetical protein